MQNFIRKIKDVYHRQVYLEAIELIVALFRIKPRKIIVGSGGTRQRGFFSTEKTTLDITNKKDWEKLTNENSLEIILAEHVFEHLTLGQINKALKNCYIYLRPGGRIRIAVPDKNRRDAVYVKAVKPPNDGHRSYLNVSELTKILRRWKFNVIPLEYFNNRNVLVKKEWNPDLGFVKRSLRFDQQEKFKRNNYYYTSLIVDAVK